ncbi:MAG: hypothetical protein K9M98_01775 [Cephaloticoccus sp.]|nr:hypothetical protein [Cephaloticoccus sp.]MCF7759207.1 hypothetical protein [Cephaloticoccus sp.]
MKILSSVPFLPGLLKRAGGLSCSTLTGVVAALTHPGPLRSPAGQERLFYNPVALGTQTMPCIVVLQSKKSANEFYDEWG